MVSMAGASGVAPAPSEGLEVMEAFSAVAAAPSLALEAMAVRLAEVAAMEERLVAAAATAPRGEATAARLGVRGPLEEDQAIPTPLPTSTKDAPIPLTTMAVGATIASTGALPIGTTICLSIRPFTTIPPTSALEDTTIPAGSTGSTCSLALPFLG